MSTDFATLLSHCTSRIDSHADSARDCEDLSQEYFSESDELSTNETTRPVVRSGIKDIIEDKIKKRKAEINVNIVESMQMHGVGADVEKMGSISNKPKILFSLKDFLDRSDDPNVSTEGEHLENQDNDHTNKFSHGSGSHEINNWSDDNSDVISDSDSDLELADEIDVDESRINTERNTTAQIGDRFHSSQDSFESELDVMDELKRRLDDSIVNAPRTENNIDRYCMGGSNLNPINIDDDGDDNGDLVNDHEVNSMVKARLDVNGLSISVVGGDGSSNNFDIETLLTKRLNTSQRSQPKPNLGHKISVQKNVPVISDYVPGKEELKKSSSTFLSGDDIPGDQSAPIITLDENIQVEDISSDEEIFEHVDDDVHKFDNCAHGDLADYICASCAYSRWRCERGFVNNLQVQPGDRAKDRGLTIERVHHVATAGQPHI